MSVPGLYRASATTATPLCGRLGNVRLCVVPCLAGGPSPDTQAPFSFALPWAEGTSGRDLKFPCMFWRFLLVTWALSLVPIVAIMSVLILLTSGDRRWTVGSLAGFKHDGTSEVAQAAQAAL